MERALDNCVSRGDSFDIETRCRRLLLEFLYIRIINLDSSIIPLP
jgi:hypothetical protein